MVPEASAACWETVDMQMPFHHRVYTQSSPYILVSVSLSLSLATGGNRNFHIDSPTNANAELATIHASPIQAPPSSRPTWKALVIVRLAITPPIAWISSRMIYSRAVSSCLTNTVIRARVRKRSPRP